MIGKPHDVFCEKWRTTIYPFSWILKDASKVRECPTPWQWIRPQDVLDGSCDDKGVSSSKSIWRVWLRSGGLFSHAGDVEDTEHGARELHESLLAMRNDHESGARHMATTALQHLHDVLATIKTRESKGLLWRQTRMIAWHLIHNGRPSMNAAISKTLLSCLWKLWFVQESRAEMLVITKACIQDRRAFGSRIGNSFVAFLQRHFQQRLASGQTLNLRILTLSSSIIKSAVLTALRKCNVSFDIRILESRPLCEGAHMAALLIKQAVDCDPDRLKITIATDASVAMMAKDVDLVLLGADRISDNGDVSNKTGSYPAALCARSLGHISSASPKVVVLSGIEKIAKPGPILEHDEEDNGSLQIWRIWDLAGGKKDTKLLADDPRVELKNVAFEWIPADCVDVYINEDGEMSREQIKVHSVSMEKLDSDVFGGL